MIVEGRNCLNCKNCICLEREKPKPTFLCTMEVRIPFFDVNSYIADPREDSCPRWEANGEKG